MIVLRLVCGLVLELKKWVLGIGLDSRPGIFTAFKEIATFIFVSSTDVLLGWGHKAMLQSIHLTVLSV